MAEAFDVIGAREIAAKYEARSHRALMPAPGLEAIYPELEARERELFGEYHGKYVNTGALKASLTQPEGTDALREAHGSEAVFGTKVWYAIYQGTTGVGSHGPPSAIMDMPEAVKHATASEAVVRYIVEGHAEEEFAMLAGIL